MSYFLWPEARLDFRSLWARRGATMASIEAHLAELYPDACAVLFSSARAGLAAVIVAMDLTRSDRVWLPPYTNHCVFDAVSRIATPTPVFSADDTAAALVFHQWGYPHACSFAAEIIEDSADSLCLPGSGLFPNGGRFALWSLPKVIGSAIGGVVFCGSQDDAVRLRRIREERDSIGWMQFVLKTLLHSRPIPRIYWQGAEALNGDLPRIACCDIQEKLDRLESIIQDRQAKLALFRSHLPDWLQRDPSRLPSNVPVECSAEQATAIRALGVTSGFRSFNKSQTSAQANLVKVLPIPIHQDVCMARLESMIKVLVR